MAPTHPNFSYSNHFPVPSGKHGNLINRCLELLINILLANDIHYLYSIFS